MKLRTDGHALVDKNAPEVRYDKLVREKFGVQDPLVVLIQPTHLDGIPTHPEQGPGPFAAVRQFLSEPMGRNFEQDFTREAMVMTSYPGGWLRRKR